MAEHRDVVQIAVAHMADDDGHRIREMPLERLSGLLDERRNAVSRHSDVVRDAHTFTYVRLRDAVPDFPQIRALLFARRDYGVAEDAVIERLAQILGHAVGPFFAGTRT